MTRRRIDRRRFLTLAGSALTVVAAGCTDGAPENDGNGEDDETEDGEIGGDNETEDGGDGEDDGTGAGNETEDNETGAGNETEDNETGAGNETEDNETEDGGDGGEEVIVGPDGDYVFEPEELTVAPGTTVTFTWDSDTHNIAVQNQPDDANWEGHEDIEDEGFEHEHTFEVAGEYDYVCEPHESQGMTGTIIVEEG